MSKKEWFSDFARGAALGTGILPGVSVGTVGIIFKIYDKLIEAISGLRKKLVPSFLALLPIALGCIISAVALLIFWKKVAYVYFPFIIIAILAGFVIGAFPLIAKELREQKLAAGDLVRIGIGFLVASAIGVVSFLCAAGIIPFHPDFYAAFDAPFASWWILIVVFFVGFIAAVACLIPGISGSMVLFIFGLYNPVVSLFISDRDPEGNVTHASIFHDTSKLGGGLVIIAILLVGILVGFIATSTLMKKALEQKRRATYGLVVGFVLGSLVSMFLNNDMYSVYTNPQTNQWFQFVIGGVLGVATAIGTYLIIRKQIAAEE